MTEVRRALISVSDRTGIVELARALCDLGVELVATGGTGGMLRQAGLAVRDVADCTGFPEIMDGRLKTLHPRIHGALLGRRGVDDAVMREHGIEPIDLLVVNLYPFARTVADPRCGAAEAIEQIDVGGPAMLRAAAKNHERVAVLVDPADYGPALEALRAHGGFPDALRRRLAAKAFAHTAAYDTAVASWMNQEGSNLTPSPANQEGSDPSLFPDTLRLTFSKRQALRYGENPHQPAAFYVAPEATGTGIATATLLQGKELSYNNLADADAAIECVRQFERPACVIVKHATPCGAAVADSALDAYLRAHRTDPTSAYGGIVAFNRAPGEELIAALLERQFVEVLAAPDLGEAARELLRRKPSIRALATGDLEAVAGTPVELKSVTGGLLVQHGDRIRVGAADFKVVTGRAPEPRELDDLLFAWRVCRFVKSNAIVYARDGATLGIGGGQTSRVLASRIAALRAREEGLDLHGAVMASDAFLPFRDGLDVAAGHGISAVIQPGGSLRDAEVVAAADAHGMAMVFTGIRNFRH